MRTTFSPLRLSLCVLAVMLFPFAVSARVYISEVNWAGSDLSTADEWLELSTDAETDISGWQLWVTNSSGVDQLQYTFPADTTILPDQYLVLSRQSAGQSRLSAEPFFQVTGLSLLNTKLLLKLKDATEQVIDQADDGVGNPLAGANPAVPGFKASMERVRPDLSGSLPEAWQTAYETRGFDTGTAMYGTPGQINSGLGAFSSSSSSQSHSSSSSNFSSSESSWSSSVVSSSTESSQSSSSSVLSSSASSSDASVLSSYHLVLGELMSDPTGSNSAQWLEILNTGEEAVALKGVSLVAVEQADTYQFAESTVLPAGNALLLPRSLTAISLSPNGGTLELRAGQAVLDTVAYPSLPTNVSYQRQASGAWQLACVPTPGSRALQLEWSPFLEIQSGTLSAEKHVSLNITTNVLPLHSEPTSCTVAFGDGEFASVCNPPSHTYSSVGRYALQVDLLNACGNSAHRYLTVEVLPTGTKVSEVSSSSLSSLVISSASSSSLVAPALSFLYRQSSSHSSVSSAVLSAQVSPVTAAWPVELLSSVSLFAVLPNPAGKDDDREWVEICNTSPQLQVLSGMVLRNAKGKSFAFTNQSVAANATGRFLLPRSFTLNNTSGSLELLAGEKSLGLLQWQKAKDDQVIGVNQVASVRSSGKATVTTKRSTRSAKPKGLTKRAKVVMETAGPTTSSGMLALVQQAYAAEQDEDASEAEPASSAWDALIVALVLGVTGAGTGFWFGQKSRPIGLMA